MEKKYRIKLKNDRIIGPFFREEVGELYQNDRIDGTEMYQVFPIGDWVSLKEIDDLSSYMLKIVLHKKHMGMPGGHKDAVNNTKVEKFATKDGHVEFDYDRTERHRKAAQQKDNEELEVGRTRVVSVAPSEEDKRESEPKDQKKELKEETEESPSLKEQNELAKISTTQKTEVVNLGNYLSEVKKLQETEIKELSAPSDKDDVVEEKKEELSEQSTLEPDLISKKKRPLIMAALLFIFWFLFFADSEEESKEIAIKSVRISFPVVKDVENSRKGAELRRLGENVYSKGRYPDKLKAAVSFKKSLENKFRKNSSLGLLILTYAELYNDAVDKRKAGSDIFRLIEIARNKGDLLKDINAAIGTMIFYMNIKKYSTALNVAENYLRVSNPSLKFLSYYLGILINAGELSKASNVYEKLKGVPKLPLDGYIFGSKFLAVNEKYKQAEEFLLKGIRAYPNSVKILLEYAKYSLRERDYDKYAGILSRIKGLRAESSPNFYSKYLEHMGILSAMKKDNKSAVVLFKKALKINNSEELREKLASLSLGGIKQVDELIIESKVLQLMLKARKKMRLQQWEEAVRLAIEAVDFAEAYLPAQLLLAEIQLKRGHMSRALSVLEQLYKDFPLNMKVNFALINGYIEALRMSDAQKHIINLASSPKIKNSPEFASLNGRFYLRLPRTPRNILFVIKWLQMSINGNPLNDVDYYSLARIYLEIRRYKKSKNMITKAISLDPANARYRVLYSKILYELTNVETAVGYLMDFLEKNRENPVVLGQIAIFYYKSGQTKQFEIYKKKVEELTEEAPEFYRFLIESSNRNDDISNAIKYSEALIRMRPGDLETRKSLAKLYLSSKMVDNAVELLHSIIDRIPSYPESNYLLAECYIRKKDYKKAEEAARNEIKFNPSLERGYYILGRVFSLRKNYTQAIKYLEKAISIDLNSVDALYLLGWIKHRQNYWHEARELFERVLAIGPGHIETHRELGFVYKSIGQSALAIESFKVYLRLRPNAKDKRRIRSEIKRLR